MISATKGNVAVRQRQGQPALRTTKLVFDLGDHCHFLVTAQPAPLSRGPPDRRVKLINWAKSQNTVFYLASVSKLNQANTDERFFA